MSPFSHSVVSDSVQPHRWQPSRLPRPWDSPGKNTAVGCHFLLQCMKVKSDSEGGTVMSDAELYSQKMPAEDIAYYAVYERVKVMLIPNDDANY